MSKEIFIAAGQIILQAKADIAELFKGTEYQAPALLVNHQMDQLVNRMHFLGGANPVVSTSEQFPPITSFMGEEINREGVQKEEIIPDDLEKTIFLDKVEALYDVFNQMTPDKILNSYTIPEDVLVLRGVAKKAGVKGASKKELTVPFIEEIKAAIQKKAEDAEKKAAYEAELAAKQKKLPPDEMSENQAKAAAITDAGAANDPQA